MGIAAYILTFSVNISGLTLLTKTGEPSFPVRSSRGRIALLSLFRSHVVLQKFPSSLDGHLQSAYPSEPCGCFYPESATRCRHHGPIWTFAIRKFFIDSLQAQYLDRQVVRQTFHALRFRTNVGRRRFYVEQYWFLALLDYSGHTLTLDTLYYSMRSGARGFTCDSVLMKSGHLTAHGSCAIPSQNPGPIQADVVVRADNSFFKGINARAWGLDKCDMLSCSASLRGHMEHPTLNANAEITNVILKI